MTLLGKEGKAIVDETEKGWFIQYVDRDPKALARQQQAEQRHKHELDEEERHKREIEAQVKAAAELLQKSKAEEELIDNSLVRSEESEKIAVALNLDTGVLLNKKRVLKGVFSSSAADDEEEEKDSALKSEQSTAKKMRFLDPLISSGVSSSRPSSSSFSSSSSSSSKPSNADKTDDEKRKQEKTVPPPLPLPVQQGGPQRPLAARGHLRQGDQRVHRERKALQAERPCRPRH